MMIGCKDALDWVEKLSVPDQDRKECVLNRMRYEFEKDRPARPAKHKGKHIMDYYTCGNCGAHLPEAHWKYCPNCGYRIGERN